MGGETAIPAIDEPIRHVRSPQLCEKLAAVRLEPLSRLQRRLDGQIVKSRQQPPSGGWVMIRGPGAGQRLSFKS